MRMVAVLVIFGDYGMSTGRVGVIIVVLGHPHHAVLRRVVMRKAVAHLGEEECRRHGEGYQEPRKPRQTSELHGRKGNRPHCEG